MTKLVFVEVLTYLSFLDGKYWSIPICMVLYITPYICTWVSLLISNTPYKLHNNPPIFAGKPPAMANRSPITQAVHVGSLGTEPACGRIVHVGSGLGTDCKWRANSCSHRASKGQASQRWNCWGWKFSACWGQRGHVARVALQRKGYSTFIDHHWCEGLWISWLHHEVHLQNATS